MLSSRMLSLSLVMHMLADKATLRETGEWGDDDDDDHGIAAQRLNFT